MVRWTGNSFMEFILDSIGIIIIIMRLPPPPPAYSVPITEVLLHILLVTFSESSGLVKGFKYCKEWKVAMLLYKTAEGK